MPRRLFAWMHRLRTASSAPGGRVQPRALIVAAMVAAVGMLTMLGVVLYEERAHTLDYTRESAGNLVTIVERDLVRNFEFYALSLQAMVDGLRDPAVMRLPHALRDQVLFDRAVMVRHVSSAFVVDARGKVLFSSGPQAGLDVDVSDRDYFVVHRERADAGLFLSAPFVSRLNGGSNIALTQRVSRPDGSFAGVAVIAITTDYFRALLEGVQMGRGDVLSIVRLDGTQLMRIPYDPVLLGRSFRDSPVFRRAVGQEAGSFTARASTDGTRRLYVFRRVENFPLVVVAGQALDDVLAGWRHRAMLLGAAMVAFAVGFVFLSRRVVAELDGRRRAEGELKRLVSTDSLTGLLNRRGLDALLDGAWQRARRSGKPMCVLFVDVDHFKRYNDTYGHVDGDAVLAELARLLRDCLTRPGYHAARYGGEEFVVVLTDTDLPGAHAIAAAVRAAVAARSIPHEGGIGGAVTISVGLAGSRQGMDSAEALVAAADQALYVAKAMGRNRAVAYVPSTQRSDAES